MVLKKSKYGHNTGCTQRYADKLLQISKARLTTIQISGRFADDIDEQDDLPFVDTLKTFHSDVEYSLNKSQRWDLPDRIENERFEVRNVNLVCCEQKFSRNVKLETKIIRADSRRQQEQQRHNNYTHKFKADDKKKVVKSKNQHFLAKCAFCKLYMCIRCQLDEYCFANPSRDLPIVATVNVTIIKDFKPSKLATEKVEKRTRNRFRGNKFQTDITHGWTVREAFDELNLTYDDDTSIKSLTQETTMEEVQVESTQTEQIFEMNARYMPPSADVVVQWIVKRATRKLETLVLNGYGNLLPDSSIIQSKRQQTLLHSLIEFNRSVVNFLSAIVLDDLDKVKKYCKIQNVCNAKHPLTGGSALHLAIIWEAKTIAYYLINQHPELLQTVDNESRTPLHYSINDNELFTYMCANGANANSFDLDGYTAKHYRQNRQLLDLNKIQKLSRYPVNQPDDIDELIKTKNVEALEQLILNGSGNYILSKVFPSGTEDLERYLGKYVIKIEAIHQAVKDGDERTLKQLLDRKKLAYAKESAGCTPLHTAVKYDQINIAEYLLLRYPTVVNETDVLHRTPLHYAGALKSEESKEAFLRLLLKAGADPSLVDKTGLRAEQQITTASTSYDVNKSSNNLTRVVGMDSEHSAESSSSTPEPSEADLQKWFNEGSFDELEHLVLQGKTSLIERYNTHYHQMATFLDNVQKNQAKLEQIHEAIKDGNLRKVKNLIDRKKLVMARNKDGRTALHCVVMYDQAPIAEYMIKTFPDCINLKDKEKRTPLHYAAVLPDSSIYELLIANDADVAAVDKKGRTAEFYRSNPEQFSGYDKVVDTNGFNEDFDSENYGNMREAPSDETVQQWMDDGNIEELEKLVLDGRVAMIAGKNTPSILTEEFLATLPQYQSKIDAIHKAVEEGDVRRVKGLIDRPELALARDKNGATPLHNAVLHGQTDTVRYLVSRFPEVVNASDHLGRTPMHYAAADENSNVFVKLLQKAGGDAFVEDKYGHTPFFYRSNPERLKVSKLKSDAIIDQLMTGELTHALLQELEEEIVDWLHSGNLGKLEELVLNGYGDLLLGKLADADNKDVLNFLEILPQYQAKIQAIHRAIENDSLREVKALLDRKKLALARDRKGATPLHKAVLHNRIDITTWLLKNYPQAVNALDHNKRTPLHYAGALSALDGGQLYKLLCKANANQNAEDCDFRNPKYYLRNPTDLDLESLRQDSRGISKSALQQRVAPSYLESSIQQWLREGNVQKLDQLVLSGCGDLLQDRKATNAEAQAFLDDLQSYLDQVALLHKSVREGDMRTIKAILERKKMALARDRKGATPLHDAILYQQTDVTRYIVSNFPHVINASDYNKRTPSHYAAGARDGGHYYKILEKAGADTSLTDKEGKTPVFYLRNPGKLDLKMILDRDRDFVPDLPLMLYNGSEDDSRSESKLSDISVTTPPDGGLTMDEDNPIKMTKSSNANVSGGLWMRRSPPTSENGKFLAQVVGVPLTKALAEAVIRRPADPIAFIADYLLEYHKENACLQTQMESDSGASNEQQKATALGDKVG